MVDRDKLHIAKKIGAIMDSVEPTHEGHDTVSINIQAPCTNRIAGGDYYEVNVYLNDNAGREEQSEKTVSDSTCEDRDVNSSTCKDDLAEIVPKAVRIARSLRLSEWPT